MAERLAYGRATLDGPTGDGPLRFVASSTGVNRYGYALRNDGWRLEAYNANPVLLWMHNPMRPPIGQGKALSDGERIILDDVTFDHEDELATQVESKYRRGFLNAVSVGFHFLNDKGEPVEDWWRLSNEQINTECLYDLAEVSAVSVPGDPRAIAEHSRLALASLGRELVDLFDEQEHGTITKPELRAAVRAELIRLGVRIDPKDDPDETPGQRAEDVRPDADGSVGVDEAAAQAVLAAFNREGIHGG